MRYHEWHITPLGTTGMEVRWRIQPVGLRPAWETDDPEAELWIALPGTGSESYLHPALRFCERLSVLGEALTAEWGDVLSGWRIRRVALHGTSWSEAIERALNLLQSEIYGIAAALQRRQGLVEAGRDYGLGLPATSSLASPAGVVKLNEIAQERR